MRLAYALGVAIGLLGAIQPAFPEVSEQEAKRLGADLTPYGAEKAGNAAGTIPAWEGLIGAPPALGYKTGMHHPNPFAADKPLYTITSANMAQYDAILTEGHKAMLVAHPDSYKMDVYPTRRSCAYPQHVLDAVKRNAVNAKMINDGNSITGATMGPPFPIPQSAREVLWNHELNYRGFKLKRTAVNAAVTKGGDFTPEVVIRRNYYLWSDPAITSTEELGNIVYFFLGETTSPSTLAGTFFLLHYTLDQVAEDRKPWNYRPGERRVKRLSGLQYDTSMNGSDGIRTIDNFQTFNGGADRYDWELLGKQEKLIPYNNYQLASPDLKYKDVLKKGHLNQDLIRYELHRTWAVEGKLKPGKSHSIVHRRKFYHDEDTWIIGATALYGPDGRLARAQEAFMFNYYDQPLCLTDTDVMYDVDNKVYHMIGMRNQEQEIVFNPDEITRDTFTTEHVRRMGTR